MQRKKCKKESNLSAELIAAFGEEEVTKSTRVSESRIDPITASLGLGADANINKQHQINH